MTTLLAPNRKEYMADQKERFGRHLFGVFPAAYPREILWAMNVLPVEIWDPPMPASDAAAHLQPYICSVVKLGLELILQGHTDDLDGFVFSHTCDSLQNLASVVAHLLGEEKPCHFFYHPKEPFAPTARAYYRRQLQEFAAGLERQLGPLDLDRLRQAIDQSNAILAQVQQLYRKRSAGTLSASNTDFYDVIRQGEFLHPDDFSGVLDSASAEFDGPAQTGTGILISGILPNPRMLLQEMDALGLRVVADDLLNAGRRYLVPPTQGDDPWDVLTDQYFAMPPCSTRCTSLASRRDHLLALARDAHARGVVFLTVKFCEPELFDLPILMDELRRDGLHVLALDVELHQAPSGQLKTQLQAFAEMMS